MILVDTNIIIEIYRDNIKIINLVKKIGEENLAVSDVTCAELLYGARNRKELGSIKKDLNKLAVIHIDSEISKLSVNLVEKFSLSHNLSLPDSLIASTAIINNLKLLTLNTKDFKFIEGVSLYEI